MAQYFAQHHSSCCPIATHSPTLSQSSHPRNGLPSPPALATDFDWIRGPDVERLFPRIQPGLVRTPLPLVDERSTINDCRTIHLPEPSWNEPLVDLQGSLMVDPKARGAGSRGSVEELPLFAGNVSGS